MKNASLMFEWNCVGNHFSHNIYFLPIKPIYNLYTIAPHGALLCQVGFPYLWDSNPWPSINESDTLSTELN